MNKTPIYIDPPTFRDYEDIQIGMAYANGWNDAMDAIFPEEVKKRQIEQTKKRICVLHQRIEVIE